MLLLWLFLNILLVMFSVAGAASLALSSGISAFTLKLPKLEPRVVAKILKSLFSIKIFQVIFN